MAKTKTTRPVTNPHITPPLLQTNVPLTIGALQAQQTNTPISAVPAKPPVARKKAGGIKKKDKKKNGDKKKDKKKEEEDDSQSLYLDTDSSGWWWDK